MKEKILLLLGDHKVSQSDLAKILGRSLFSVKSFSHFRISVTSTGLMKGRQDTGRGKLFTCYIKMKYVSKLSEIWNWKLRSNSYWRSELINSLKMYKKILDRFTLSSGMTRRCLTSTTRSRPWRSSGGGRSRTWPRSPFDQRLKKAS